MESVDIVCGVKICRATLSDDSLWFRVNDIGKALLFKDPRRAMNILLSDKSHVLPWKNIQTNCISLNVLEKLQAETLFVQLNYCIEVLRYNVRSSAPDVFNYLKTFLPKENLKMNHDKKLSKDDFIEEKSQKDIESDEVAVDKSDLIEIMNSLFGLSKSLQSVGQFIADIVNNSPTTGRSIHENGETV